MKNFFFGFKFKFISPCNQGIITYDDNLSEFDSKRLHCHMKKKPIQVFLIGDTFISIYKRC